MIGFLVRGSQGLRVGLGLGLRLTLAFTLEPLSQEQMSYIPQG